MERDASGTGPCRRALRTDDASARAQSVSAAWRARRDDDDRRPISAAAPASRSGARSISTPRNRSRRGRRASCRRPALPTFCSSSPTMSASARPRPSAGSFRRRRSTVSLRTACATPTFIRPRCARRRGRRCSPDVIITRPASASSPKRRPGYPGYDTIIGKDTATSAASCARTATARLGSARTTTRRPGRRAEAGPLDRWPTGLGFEHFFGFVGGDTSQWQPICSRDTTAIYPYVGKPGWNLTTAMADDAIHWLHRARRHQSVAAVLPALRAGRHARAAPGRRRNRSTRSPIVHTLIPLNSA